MLNQIAKSRITTIALIFLILVLAVQLSGYVLDDVQADATQDDLYSLTDGSRAILARMQEEGVTPVDLELYFSETAGKTLPKFIKDFITYERYLRSLLGQYEEASEGKVRVQFVDPVPDSDEAQDALDYGLEGKAINQEGDLFFFGLVFETQTGNREVIEFLWPEGQESIEYEISSKLHSLVWPSSKRIAVLSSLEVLGSGDNPYLQQMLAAQGKQPTRTWTALELLGENYELESVDFDTESLSREDYDLVLVIHPKDLPDKTLWALDEWITTGGKALILVDPYALADQPPQNPQQPFAAMQYRPSSNLDRLFAAWGLRRPEDRFAADFDLAVKRQMVARGPAETMILDLAIDTQTAEDTLAAGHPALQGLTSLRFFLAGSLEKTETTPDGVQLTPLVTTTAAGSTLEIQPGFGAEGLHLFDLQDAAKLRDRFSPGSEPVVLAYQVSGRLPSAFPQGAEFPSEVPIPPPGLPPGIQLPPPEDAEIVTKEPVSEDRRAESTVLVFADVDVLADQIAFNQAFLGLVSPANDNYKLLLNAADFLLGAQELMDVRAKSRIRRPFTRFDEIEAEAEKESLERERELRAEVESFQQQLQDMQSDMTQPNAALLERQVRDEVDRLNERIRDANRELFEIRKQRRAALEREEAKVRFSVLWAMPLLVLALGIASSIRRRRKLAEARGQ